MRDWPPAPGERAEGVGDIQRGENLTDNLLPVDTGAVRQLEGLHRTDGVADDMEDAANCTVGLAAGGS